MDLRFALLPRCLAKGGIDPNVAEPSGGNGSGSGSLRGAQEPVISPEEKDRGGEAEGGEGAREAVLPFLFLGARCIWFFASPVVARKVHFKIGALRASFGLLLAFWKVP